MGACGRSEKCKAFGFGTRCQGMHQRDRPSTLLACGGQPAGPRAGPPITARSWSSIGQPVDRPIWIDIDRALGRDTRTTTPRGNGLRRHLPAKRCRTQPRITQCPRTRSSNGETQRLPRREWPTGSTLAAPSTDTSRPVSACHGDWTDFRASPCPERPSFCKLASARGISVPSAWRALRRSPLRKSNGASIPGRSCVTLPKMPEVQTCLHTRTKRQPNARAHMQHTTQATAAANRWKRLQTAWRATHACASS